MLVYPLTADVPTIEDVFSFLLPDRVELPMMEKTRTGWLLTKKLLRSVDFKSMKK